VERGRKSLWKSFEERHALRVVHVVCEFRGWQKSTIRDVILNDREGEPWTKFEICGTW
jgi:hypothetical protein